MRTRKLAVVGLAVFALILIGMAVAQADLIWFDGSRDSGNAPRGKLLSDNPGYWGECVLTGVDYKYEAIPDSPSDGDGSSGRALINGSTGAEAGMSGGKPLVVVFDFKRVCDFSEWDVVTPTKRVAITIEVRGTADEAWTKVYERSLEACPDKQIQRIKFANRPKGRFARLTVQSPGTTQLGEVLAWGDAQVSESAPEAINPVAQGQYPVGVAYPTLTGISKSSVSDRESFNWVRSLKPQHKKQAAVWAKVPTWEAISNTPVIPDSKAINKPVYIVMSRNETETAAIALKNTLVDSPRSVEVKLSRFTGPGSASVAGLSGKMGVFGVIGDRAFGNNLGPIFEADNLLGKSLMKKYLLNGSEIADFPRIALPPSGSAVLWLSVTSENAKPGVYKAYLLISGGELVTVKVEVLDVTLPVTFAHVGTYSGNRTGMFPFEYADRTQRDFSYALDSGISEWGYSELVRKMAKQRGMKLMYEMGLIIPFWSDPATDYVGMIWQGRWAKESDFPKDAPEAVAAKVKRVVDQAKALGLKYDEWFGSTGDEPGAGNIAAIAYMCRLIKQADPNVNIYVNPCYWSGFDNGGVSDDATVSRGLLGQGASAGWYRKYVDISMPLKLLLRDHPLSLKEFSTPRKVNSYYLVSGHLGRSEEASEVQLYRRMAWDSFSLGFNGWAFYAWCSPRANPWNHFDKDGREPSDYSIVYPGPRGVVPTRQSEALREGWEDWRLLNLLKQRGLHQILNEVMQAYKAGKPVEELRLRALRAAQSK